MTRDAHRESVRVWMDYIDAEVVAVCRKNRWGHQIRRKWSVRERPVSTSTIDDYEWKLIPSDPAESRGTAPTELYEGKYSITESYEGVYFVLGFDSRRDKFILQHDTHHAGPESLTETYTEIYLPHGLRAQREMTKVGDRHPIPAADWLAGFLLDLTAKFQPNSFRLT